MMKKILLLSTIMMATTVLAFGGGGGRKATSYEPGLVAVGVHFGGKGQANVDFNHCPEGSSTTGQGGETDVWDGDIMCKCNEADKVYTMNGCEPQPEVCNDHTINQCGLGYYCQFSPSDCGDSDRGDGVCTTISGGTEIIPDGNPNKTYLKGPETDWWSAYSWCRGNNMNLVTGTIAGKALNSSYVNGDGHGPLYTYFGQDIYFWTGHDAGDSCNAWLVDAYPYYEYVSGANRNGGGYYRFASALCE